MIDVKGIAEAVKQFEGLKAAGVLGVDVLKGWVQLYTPAFNAAFTSYAIETRDSEKFPFKRFVIVDGVEFFTLCTEAELSEDDRLLIERGRVGV